jgi:hypothetical protein
MQNLIDTTNEEFTYLSGRFSVTLFKERALKLILKVCAVNFSRALEDLSICCKEFTEALSLQSGVSASCPERTIEQPEVNQHDRDSALVGGGLDTESWYVLC